MSQLIGPRADREIKAAVPQIRRCQRLETRVITTGNLDAAAVRRWDRLRVMRLQAGSFLATVLESYLP